MHATTLSLPILTLGYTKIQASQHGGVTDTIYPSRGPWHKSEIDHINIVGFKGIKIGVWTHCSNKHYSQIRIVRDNDSLSTSVVLYNPVRIIKRS